MKIKNLAIVIMILLPLTSFALSTKELAVSINLAGKQRMLSQKMTKEVLLVKASIKKEDNLKSLQKSRDLFHTTLNGLIKGDKSLKLTASKDDKIQNQLKIVQNIWKSFDSNIQKVLGGKADKKTFKKIQEENMTLLKEMNNAVILYVSQSKESSSKRAQAINLSGKERMLTQKMAKELLSISQGLNAKINTQNLQKTTKLFKQILHGLQKGDVSLNLEANKLPKIKKQLKAAEKLYKKIEPTFAKSITNKKALRVTIENLDTLRKEMDSAVKLFEKSIKREKQALKLSSLVNQFMQKKSAQNHIINLCGKQRMLTQKMTKLALLVSLNIDKKNNSERLIQTNKLYEKTLQGFLYGDSLRNIEKTNNKDILAYIKTVQKEWKPFSSNIQTLAKSSKKDTKSLSYIIKKNEKLLDISNKLVQLFKQTQTKQTFMDKARANIVDIAGRQRMLTQKMTKEKLLIVAKVDIKINKKKLQKSITLFDTSLQALVQGDEILKLPQPSNKKVLKQLQVVASMWRKLKPLYLKNKLQKSELMTIIQDNPLLLKEMNKAVKLSETVADY